MILSKSNFLLYLRHPAWLWLEKHNKSILPEVDDNTQAIFDAGNLFETYAEQLFPEGVTLGYKTNGKFDGKKYWALPETTQRALEEKVPVLFQGRLEIQGITCIFDVLERNENGTYNLYEIKSSTKAKPEHEHDLAFQTIVLESSGLSIESMFVIHVNNEYVRNGTIPPEEITDITEVTSAVRTILPQTMIDIEDAKAVMASHTMPDPSPRHARLGSFAAWMEIYTILQPHLDPYNIYKLCSPGARRIGELEDGGIQTIADIPDDENLTVKQRYQVQATQMGTRIIKRDEIETFLQTFQYPLYFFDYETLASVVPPFDGMRPYQQVPFQYSLHILRDPLAPLEHREFLHTENSSPVQHLVKQLKSDIGSIGSVVVWYQNFEKSCNVTLANFVPEHREFLYALNDRIVDLMIPFSEGWFVDKDFFGSASIKAVLPVLVPELSYKDLVIQGGATAQNTWMSTIFGGKNQNKKDIIMEDMRKYCTLDTLAMVKIWEVLSNVSSEEALLQLGNVELVSKAPDIQSDVFQKSLF
ncbi:TPA: hypothetical protein DEP58_03890 [Patescibacteria group bacterium]|nr:MAG: hypothetical protein UU98_C0005G0033 [Parcubacteria group bacterium GW2011_GWD2_42_14]HCC05415.1 hypothetical protein [Patescibacteria group bacterium]